MVFPDIRRYPNIRISKRIFDRCYFLINPDILISKRIFGYLGYLLIPLNVAALALLSENRHRSANESFHGFLLHARLGIVVGYAQLPRLLMHLLTLACAAGGLRDARGLVRKVRL